MHECSEDNLNLQSTPNDLIYFVHRLELFLLFSNTVFGFSVEEHTLAENWWTGDIASDPWEWRHILAWPDEMTYGKFYKQRAGYISKA